ncbi:MAG: protein-export chaperone SecB [Duncaniella sp.]|nr:protein-export chaperone SecB [Duncaniella sp.]
MPNNDHIDAAFSFENYKFTEAYINLGALTEEDGLNIDFLPSGVYDPKTGVYEMTLGFCASIKGANDEFVKIVKVKCIAIFKFRTVLPFEDIPMFFFTNSTAIIYPYIRAFVSTLTVQANFNAIVLPTLNISTLGVELKERTTIKK